MSEISGSLYIESRQMDRQTTFPSLSQAAKNPFCPFLPLILLCLGLEVY